VSTAERAISWTLFVSAAVAIVVGIATIVIAHTLTRSRIAQSTELLSDNLRTAQKVVETLAEQRDELTNIRRLAPHTADVAGHLPTLAAETNDVLRATVKTLRRTAGSLRAYETSADLLASGGPISKNADALVNLADRMRKLREALLDTRQSTRELVAQLEAAVGAQRVLRQALADSGVGLELLADRLDRTRQLRRRANLPAAAAWQQTGAGFGFVLVGILLGGVGMVWRRLVRENSGKSLPPHDS